MENSIEENSKTKTIDALKLSIDNNPITFQVDRILTKEELQKKIDGEISSFLDRFYNKLFGKKVEVQERIVTVKVIDCGCFF